MESVRKALGSATTNPYWSYQPLEKAEEDGEQPTSSDTRNQPKFKLARRVFILSVLFLLAIAVIPWRLYSKRAHRSTCRDPVLRQEWRDLNRTQQHEYITAIRCFMDTKSAWGPDSTRFDDFAYAHVFEGQVTHYAAAFLPWHRYFIHIYEKTLTEECQYHGALPYWDWGLDAHDLTASPLFDPITGFGGNGSQTSPKAGIFEGHCVTDGPFANTTRQWVSESNGHQGFDLVRKPHCFSRGFKSGQDKDELQDRVSPSAIEGVLSVSSYLEFVDALEVQAHNSIPQIVRGDFYGLTAPNDPIFYLHHAQVDRLWWLWQQRDPKNRLSKYQGPAENVRVNFNASRTASSLDDAISVGNLSEPVRVRDLMTTESDLLCYHY